MKVERPDPVPFNAHAELLQSFLAHRQKIVERLQDVLNAQRKPVEYLQDRPLLSRHIEDCFYPIAAVTDDQARLRGRLDEAHWASGFRPRKVPGLHNDLIAPAEMAMRAFHMWRQTRWPGRNGRVRYAHTLFNLYLIRCLELMSMRAWDAGPSEAGERLAQVQNLLDALWMSSPSDQPALVRDARWLIPLAQSPTTDELAAYFDVAEHVAETLDDADRIEVQKAGVRMIGGHLRSQIRHYCLQDRVSIDDASVVRRTRTSNALDFALLVQGLALLVDAYDDALQSGDAAHRRELAGAILQGISPDPEAFLNRVDLLGPYSMIEYLFVAADPDEQAAYTPMGQRHVRLLGEYAAKIGRLAAPLLEDCPRLRPVAGAYSPYGAIYGTPTNLLEDMALKTLQPDAVTRFGLEDVFADVRAAEDGDRLAWVNGWRNLPHVDREVQRLYQYPQQFADEIFDRIEQALRRRAEDSDANEAPRAGRLFVLHGDDPDENANASQIPDLPARYIRSSDRRLVAAHKAEPVDQAQLLHDRQEGHYVLSFETFGGWVAVSKDMLTEVLGAGRDARLTGVPPEAAAVLSLTCPGLIVSENAP